MSLLVSNKLKQICPDTWVARAYSDYMADCAAAQAQLLAAITQVASNESLDSIINTRSSSLCEQVEQIKQYVFDYLLNNTDITPEELSPESDLFLDTFEELYNDESQVQFKFLVDTLTTAFPQIPTDDPLETAVYIFVERSIDDILVRDSSIDDVADHVVRDALDELDLRADSVYTLNGSYVTYYNLLLNLAINTALTTSNEILAMDYQDADGNLINPASSNYPIYSVNDMIEEIKTNFASATAWSQGFAALDSADVTEALAKFEAQVGSIITDTQEKFAATVLQVKSLIASTGAKVADFLNTASEWLGFNQIQADTFTTVDATDIASYTGASPLAGLNLKTAKGVLVATGKAVAAISCAVWMGVKSLATKLWKKVKPFVKALTNDPIDIEIQDSGDKSYAIGNFMYTAHITGASFGIATEIAHYFTSDDAEIMQDALEKVENSWISMETYFSEFTFKITNPSVIIQGGGVGGAIVCDIDVKFRPRCMNVANAINYGLLHMVQNPGTMANTTLTLTDNAQQMSDATWQKYVDFLSAGDIYLDDVSKEAQMFTGFLASIWMTNAAGCKCWEELRSSFASIYGFAIQTISLNDFDLRLGSAQPGWADFYSPVAYGRDMGPTNPANQPYPSTVTNIQFITVASGYGLVGSGGGSPMDTNFKWADTCVKTSGQELYGGYRPVNIVAVLAPIMSMFFMQQFDRIIHPTDFLFLPYCKGTYDFSGGRYHIKTDAENMNVAQLLFNAIVLIVVVAAAVLICKQILKIINTKRIAKMNNYMGQCDNAIWSNNKTLSYHEQRKYLRYSKKVDKLTACSSGLLGSESKTSLISKGVTVVKDSVISSTDIPKTMATGQWTAKQQEVIDSTSDGVDNLVTLITGRSN